MLLRSFKLLPILMVGIPVGLCWLAEGLAGHWRALEFAQRLEWMTYDWRVRWAAHRPSTNASNLGFVFISDDSIKTLLSGALGYKVGLYWPRFVYGRLLEELSAQGVKSVGFDILLPELRPDHPPQVQTDGTEVSSDHYFADEIHRAGNVILAAEKGVLPADLFRTNAWALGDISAQRESDGILRRAKAYEDYPRWHPLLKEAARVWGLDLRQAIAGPEALLCPTLDGQQRTIPLDSAGCFDQAALWQELTGQTAPASLKARAKAFTVVRAWDVGIVLAARELGLDLVNARIEPEKRRLILRGKGGVERVIPIDGEGRFYIDWGLTPFDPRLTKESIESLLWQQKERRGEAASTLTNRWRDKLVVVGSVASGNDLTDLGATPLERDTYLTSRFWNVANSVITGRFIQQPPLSAKFLLMAGLAALAGLVTYRLRALWAVVSVLVLAGLYVAISLQLYAHQRYWLPLVLPVGCLLLTHSSLMSYRAFFEQSERRRVRAVFARMVSPDVVNELLKAEKLALGGARRQVTVLFADVRGFTEMTESQQAKAEEHVRAGQLPPSQAESYYDEQSQETLRTVSLYLSLIADAVKKHAGTLDKYIGDCVMAFWGAPTPNQNHALACVQAAIEAQRAINRLNQDRAAENTRRERDNAQRLARGEPTAPLLPLLSLGTGINTGMVTVGLMGSARHFLNYTVFGRDVNLAFRLEGVSGRGRIIIGETTYQELTRLAPELAAACRELAPVTVKGFRTPVSNFEVPWESSPSAAQPLSLAGPSLSATKVTSGEMERVESRGAA